MGEIGLLRLGNLLANQNNLSKYDLNMFKRNENPHKYKTIFINYFKSILITLNNPTNQQHMLNPTKIV